MKADHIDPVSVRLREPAMAEEFSRQGDTSYRSSVFCVAVLWLLVLASQIVQVHKKKCQMR